jgi:uncharacterized membrane protein
MAKQKTNHTVAKQGSKEVYQLSHEEDDNLLPSAEELQQYQALDPNFIEWIKNRCDNEQIARIQFNKEKVEIHKTMNKHMFKIDMTSIIASGIVILSAMSISAYLIYLNHALTGSIFAGGAIVFYGIRVLNFRKNQK